MKDRTVSHYRIVEKIAEGGVGVLYKARDTDLDRVVTLKFLRDFSPHDGGKERFALEARTIATLNHPNICTVHEIGESDGRIFIAMEYIDGENLHGILGERAMSPHEIADIGVQVSRGLEAAHEKGIIHRDVKSANIMLTTDGRAIVTDFGLATAGDTPLTESGLIAGSLAYMSPEQLSGGRVDERTDIWSLGVCLYEMLAGQLPFAAPYNTALGYSIMNEEIPPLLDLRPDLPFTLGLVVETALAKRARDRYTSMADMRADLETALAECAGSPVAQKRADGGAFASIAVLPFSDMSENKDQDYFCDGMAEEIINNLAQLDMMRVIARTSSFAFKNKHDDVRVIGRKLGVGYVLEGSVRRADSSLRITAQLINVADGLHLWSEQYDRKMTEVFAIQEEIAKSIADALKLTLTEREEQAMQHAATSNIDAYDRYLRGRRLFYQTKRSNIDRARNMFSEAIEKDPRFARAYAGMADCYSYLYWYFDRNPDNLKNAMAASEKALRLEPGLAEAHAAHGLALTLKEKYKEAEAEYKEAVRLNPQLFEAYYFHARTRFVQGDMEGAAELFEKACAVDPEGYQAPMMLGFVLHGLKRQDRARAVYQRGLENVEKHLETYPEDSRAFYLASSALMGTGQVKKGLRYAMRAVAVDPTDSYVLYGVACNFARIGEVDEAVYYFEKAVRNGFAHKQWIENDPDLDPIREHPRFKALLADLKD